MLNNYKIFFSNCIQLHLCCSALIALMKQHLNNTLLFKVILLTIEMFLCFSCVILCCFM